mgnify:CR=1 FL=1
MSDLEEQEQKFFIDTLGLNQEEVFEARFNLFGFFSTLQKIDKRLKQEKKSKKRKKND